MVVTDILGIFRFPRKKTAFRGLDVSSSSSRAGKWLNWLRWAQ